MTKVLATILAIGFGTVSCSQGISPVQTRQLQRPNPTSYSFPVPLAEVRAKALQVFDFDHQLREPTFGHSAGGIHLADASSHPATEGDIYLRTFPDVASSVYFGRDGALRFAAAFQLHLETRGSDTLVTVTASETKVVNGTTFGFGPCGPGQGNNYESVRPTTVEEYTILRYLGDYLGVTNMPDVIVPTP